MAAEPKDGLAVHAFADGAAFSEWLAENGAARNGIWLLFAKKGSDTASLTRQDAIDAALCEGWIDGQAAPRDERSFLLRFTPRRARSKWSQVNRTRAMELVTAGLMRPAGWAQIEAAKADGRWDAAYPPASTATPPPDLQAALDADARVAMRFADLSRADRYALLFALANARRQETRARHIVTFVAQAMREDR